MAHFSMLKRASLAAALLGTSLFAMSASADHVILDDIIVDGSACIGFDCVNGESFGFDTIRVKENNLRIHFQDTSASASFPTNDWRLIANDSSNGGLNKFSINDVDGGRTPFTIEAGAPSHSLYVEDGGRVGFGTNTPVVDLHVKSGNSPTLRLEQDGSSGFTAQTWDVAGNEANFFIRDASNGSTLPFRIRPGAPSSAIDIQAGGNVGMGTTNPEASLHIKKGAEDASIVFEQTGAVGQKWEFRNKQATGNLNIANLTTNNTPIKIDNNAANNLLKLGDNASASTVYIAGDLVVTGDCTETDGACADYVFAPDYEKMTLAELKSFVETNKHLPNVPSEAEMMKNGVSLTNMSGRLLEKVEELVLYTIEQQETIEALQSDKVALQAEMHGLKNMESRIAELEKRRQ